MKDNVDGFAFSSGDFTGEGHKNDAFYACRSTRVFDFRTKLFWFFKRLFDVIVSLALLPLLGVIALSIAALNPFFNKGPLLFFQTRMGRACHPFTAIKFRSMKQVAKIERGPNDPLETCRITKLGNFLRKSRIDELPQILNVLKGEMSLIGPRPDFYTHAVEYAKTVPGYVARHSIRPGISGLAQTRLGYVEGTEATRKKVDYDLIYVREVSYGMELSVIGSTVLTILGRGGR